MCKCELIIKHCLHHSCFADCRKIQSGNKEPAKKNTPPLPFKLLSLKKSLYKQYYLDYNIHGVARYDVPKSYGSMMKERRGGQSGREKYDWSKEVWQQRI